MVCHAEFRAESHRHLLTVSSTDRWHSGSTVLDVQHLGLDELLWLMIVITRGVWLYSYYFNPMRNCCN